MLNPEAAEAAPLSEPLFSDGAATVRMDMGSHELVVFDGEAEVRRTRTWRTALRNVQRITGTPVSALPENVRSAV